MGPPAVRALSLNQSFAMNTWGKILCVSWRLQDCTHLPRLTGLFQADDAPFSKQRPRGHFWHMTCCLQESWSQHRANLMTSSSTTFTCCRLKTVFLRESTATSAAPSSAAATVAEDAEMRTLFQLHTVQLPSQKACKWKDDQTWSLGGECTIFSLHCNTHRQSLAKDNTCMHNLVPCVHTHIYMYTHQQWSAALLLLIRKVCAKRVECLQTLGLLPAWNFFISCSYKNQKT